MPNALSYGFLSIEDLFSQRVADGNEQRTWDAVQASLDEYNRVANAMMAGMVERTTMVQEYIELPGGGTLQPLTPDGNPLPVVPSGAYTQGYPIHGAGTAWGTNRITRELITVQEADRFTDDALQKDADWRMRHILAAILDSGQWTFTDRLGNGSAGSKGMGQITILPLANGDSVTYLRRGGNNAIDNHYLAQAAAIADGTNPFPAIRTELVEHPTNSGPLVSYVPTANIAAVAGLTEFVEVDDPDINYQEADNLPTAPEAILGPGDEIIGKLKSSNIWIVEWGRLPDNYLITQALGAGPFVAMRELAAEALQGLFPEGFNEDGNHMGQRLLRWAGFAVRNRVAAVVQRVGNGSYATPVDYDAPLAT